MRNWWEVRKGLVRVPSGPHHEGGEYRDKEAVGVVRVLPPIEYQVPQDWPIEHPGQDRYNHKERGIGPEDRQRDGVGCGLGFRVRFGCYGCGGRRFHRDKFVEHLEIQRARLVAAHSATLSY